MIISSIRYLVGEGFRNLWQSRFMSLTSIGVLISCLFLTGCSYLVLVNIKSAFDWVYGQNVVVAYAQAGCTGEQLQEIQDQIQNIDNVDHVDFLSKEEMLEKYKASIPEATYEEMQGDSNPMPDSFIVTFKDMAVFDDTVSQIRQISNIDDMSYNQDLATMLAKVRQFILIAGGCITGLLFLVSLFIIANTIKLTLYNRRLEISIMKSVGATNAFVRIPFIIEGIVLGLLSALLSYGIIALLYTKLSDSLVNMLQISFLSGLTDFSTVWGTVLTGFLAIGILTGTFGSAISISKYLKDEGGISGVI